jgi:sugar lactone lactonase YvrE
MFAKRVLLVLMGLVCLSQLPRAADAQTFITAWGSYGSGNDQFLGPKGVAVGGSGDIYVVDGSRVQVFTNEGVLLRVWPSPGQNIAVDAHDNVYVSDGLHISKFTSSGILVTEWDCPGETGRPQGCLAVDGFGNVYVSTTDSGYGYVMVFSGSGAYLRFITRGNRYEWLPDGVAADATGNAFIAVNSCVEKFSPSSSFIAQWVGFTEPVRMAIGSEGYVFVVDHAASNVQVRKSNGTLVTAWGSYGASPGQFDNPIGIAVDGNGDVYVADTNNSRIQRFGFGPTPVQSVTWGSMKARYRGERGAAQPSQPDR